MANERQHARIDALRAKMKEAGIDAVIIPQADPHMGEYISSHWQIRRWFSGFSGSAGTLVVTADAALLWTDSRYFLQAAQQLEGSGIELMKDGLASTPSITDYLGGHLGDGATVGVDGMLFSIDEAEAIRDALGVNGISLDVNFDVVDDLWKDRPGLPEDKVFVHDIKYAGRTAESKLADILADARKHHADAVLISALDEIAWALNIRSKDVKNNPVAISYLYVSRDGLTTLFITESKLDDQTREYLQSQGVKVRPYGDLAAFIAALPAETRVMIETARSTAAVKTLLGSRAVGAQHSAVALPKACKNKVQIDGIRAAMERDGVALVKAFMEVERRVAEGVPTTELDVVDIFHNCRAESPMFFDESFGTIAGYADHGAIVHYEPTKESNATLRPEGLLLVDSGAQYPDGTTDITRTICLGTPTEMEKSDFTLVMKGHIALAQMIFPDDTRGAQLDAIARQFLWKHGLSYLHGTGHGVGHFLGVHEGPQSIRLNYVNIPLQPGMLTSNEPGVYREGIHGIRCENLVLCVEAMTTEFGRFLKFETMTLCPFDRNLFDLGMMTDGEIEWLNNYHATVRERLLPLLTTDEQRRWLVAKTEPLVR